MDIKINSEFYLDFEEIEKQLSNIHISENFEYIYDFAKRYINKLGLNERTIEKIYLLGYIDGKRN